MENEKIFSFLEKIYVELQDTKSEIKGLKLEIKENSTEIKGLKSEIKENSTEIKGLKSEIKENSTEIKGIKSELRELGIKFERMDDRLKLMAEIQASHYEENQRNHKEIVEMLNSRILNLENVVSNNSIKAVK